MECLVCVLKASGMMPIWHAACAITTKIWERCLGNVAKKGPGKNMVMTTERDQDLTYRGTHKSPLSTCWGHISNPKWPAHLNPWSRFLSPLMMLLGKLWGVPQRSMLLHPEIHLDRDHWAIRTTERSRKRRCQMQHVFPSLCIGAWTCSSHVTSLGEGEYRDSSDETGWRAECPVCVEQRSLDRDQCKHWNPYHQNGQQCRQAWGLANTQSQSKAIAEGFEYRQSWRRRQEIPCRRLRCFPPSLASRPWWHFLQQLWLPQGLFWTSFLRGYWRLGTCENLVKIVKGLMSKLALSEPDVSVRDALSEAARTFNEREIIRGYSPIQHAVGRVPDATDCLHLGGQPSPPSLWKNESGWSSSGWEEPGPKASSIELLRCF